MMLTVFSLPLLFGFAVGNVGKCPDPKPVEDFDLKQIEGTWHNIEASEGVDTYFRRCTRTIIKVAEGDDKKATGLEKYTFLGTEKIHYFTITTPNHSEPGKLHVKVENEHLEFPVNVLYLSEKYSVMYSCFQVLLQNFPIIRILSRTNTMDDDTRLDLYGKMKEWGLKVKLAQIDHKNCPED